MAVETALQSLDVQTYVNSGIGKMTIRYDVSWY
jgi:hypothetical protein